MNTALLIGYKRLGIVHASGTQRGDIMTGRSAASAEKSAPVRHQTNSQTRSSNPYQPVASPVDRILLLQRTLGNRAVQSLLKGNAVQAQLKAGAPGDVYEQEADRIADRVMHMPALAAADFAAGAQLTQAPSIQRVCSECEEELHGEEIEGEHEEGVQVRRTSRASGDTPVISALK
jgi:hypothetical protein